MMRVMDMNYKKRRQRNIRRRQDDEAGMKLKEIEEDKRKEQRMMVKHRRRRDGEPMSRRSSRRGHRRSRRTEKRTKGSVQYIDQTTSSTRLAPWKIDTTTPREVDVSGQPPHTVHACSPPPPPPPLTGSLTTRPG